MMRDDQIDVAAAMCLTDAVIQLVAKGGVPRTREGYERLVVKCMACWTECFPDSPLAMVAIAADRPESRCAVIRFHLADGRESSDMTI